MYIPEIGWNEYIQPIISVHISLLFVIENIISLYNINIYHINAAVSGTVTIMFSISLIFNILFVIYIL